MVPPNMTLINEKKDSILRCIKRLKDKTPVSLQELQKDIDAQDILVLNIERLIQASVDIAAHLIAYSSFPAPVTMADSFVILERVGILSSLVSQRMQKAVGLKNLLVHEYKKIDWNILWEVLKKHLDDFNKFIEEIDSKADIK